MTDQLTLAASILPLFTLDSRLSTFCPNSFRFTHFPKNTSASPLVSHTFKTKDLKPFRFTHLQKSGGGSPHLPTVVIPSELAIFVGDEGSQRSESREPQPANHNSPVTNHESLRLTPLTSTLTKNASATTLDSALTSKRPSKSFTSNTYEKHTQGEGGCLPQDARLALTVLGEGSRGTGDSRPLSTFNCQLLTVAFLARTLAQTISRVLD